jgi:hypothetical protein
MYVNEISYVSNLPKGHYKINPYLAAGCLNEVETRDGMSSRSQSFWFLFSTKKGQKNFDFLILDLIS